MMQIVFTRQGREQVKDLGKEFVIGRSGYPDTGAAVDLDLAPDHVVSRRHARIWLEGGQYWIEDLNSSNGTFVNRTKIYPGQKRPLGVSDVVQIGTVQLKVIV